MSSPKQDDDPDLTAEASALMKNAAHQLEQSRQNPLQPAADTDPEFAVQQLSKASGLSLKFLRMGLNRPWTLDEIVQEVARPRQKLATLATRGN